LRPLRPIQTRFRCGSGCPSLNLATKSNSPAHSPKGTPSDLPAAHGPKGLRVRTWHCPSTACKHTVSDSFHSLNKGSFHLSLTVLVHYRSPRVFSLGRWASLLPSGLACPLVLKVLAGVRSVSSTGVSPSLPRLPRRFDYGPDFLLLGLSSSPSQPFQPLRNIGTGPLSYAGLGCSLFARHY
jgi:hypothetical protein